MAEPREAQGTVPAALQARPVAPAWTVHAVLVSIQLAFSGWHILGAQALDNGANPFVFALYREATASAAMVGLVMWAGQSMHIKPEHRFRYVMLGVFSFMNVVGSVIALKLIPAAIFGISQPLVPIFALLISSAHGMEMLTPMKVLGVVISVSGAALVEATNLGEGKSSNAMLGALVVLGQTLGMACLIVYQKPMLKIYHPLVNSAAYYIMGTGFTVLVVLGTAFMYTPADMALHGEAEAWGALAYAIVAATVYTYSGYSWAVKRAVPSTVTLYSTLQAAFTSTLSFLFLGERLTAMEYVGGVLIALGLVVAVKAAEKIDEGGHGLPSPVSGDAGRPKALSTDSQSEAGDPEVVEARERTLNRALLGDPGAWGKGSTASESDGAAGVGGGLRAVSVADADAPPPLRSGSDVELGVGRARGARRGDRRLLLDDDESTRSDAC